MDVYDAVMTRLTVREYKPNPVPDEVVLNLLEAGRLAPSSQNLQPWHFIVIRDGDTIRRLGELATQGPFIGGAPMAIAIVTDDTPRRSWTPVAPCSRWSLWRGKKGWAPASWASAQPSRTRRLRNCWAFPTIWCC